MPVHDGEAAVLEKEGMKLWWKARKASGTRNEGKMFRSAADKFQKAIHWRQKTTACHNGEAHPFDHRKAIEVLKEKRDMCKAGQPPTPCVLVSALTTFVADGAFGLSVDWAAEYCWVRQRIFYRQHFEKEWQVQATTHGAVAVAGATAGALVGTFIFQGLGTGAEVAIGFVGGLVFNGIRMFFYPISGKRNGKEQYLEHNSEIVYAGYFADDEEWKENANFQNTDNEKIREDIFHECFMKGFVAGLVVDAKVAGTDFEVDGIVNADTRHAVLRNTTNETIQVYTYDALDATQWGPTSIKCSISIKPGQGAKIFGAAGGFEHTVTHFYTYVYLGKKRTPWPGYMMQPENVYEVQASEDGEPTMKFYCPRPVNQLHVGLTSLQLAQWRCVLAGRKLLSVREDCTITGIQSLLVALDGRYRAVGAAKTGSSATAVAGAAMVVFPVTMPAGLALLAGSAVGGLLSSSAKQSGTSAEAQNFQQLHGEDMAAMEKFREALQEYDQLMQAAYDVNKPNKPQLHGADVERTMTSVWGVAAGGVGWGATEATVMTLSGSTRIAASALGAVLAGAGALVMIADTAHSWATGKVNEEKFQDAIRQLKESNESIRFVLKSMEDDVSSYQPEGEPRR